MGFKEIIMNSIQATNIQSLFRGHLARKTINQNLQIQEYAATKIQKEFRTYKVRENNAARVTKSQQAQLDVNNNTIFVPKLNIIGSINTNANGQKSDVDKVTAII